MNYRFLSIILFWVAFSLFCFAQTADAQNAGNKVISDFIARQESRKNGYEYREGRKIMRGDVNGDGKSDAVVLYTLEGHDETSNGYYQYLAVFINRGGKLVYAAKNTIGGLGFRSLNLKSIVNNEINLDVTEFLEDDPECCPSGKGNTKFILSGGKLKEVKLPPADAEN